MRKKLIGITAILVVVALVAGVFLLNREDNNRVARGNYTVVMDGWSHKSMESFPISYKGSNLKWEKAGKGTVEEILKESPESIRVILARMYSGDPSIRCDNQGCTVNGQSVDLDVLTSPSSINTYGDIYKGWKVGGGVYTARIEVLDRDSSIGLNVNNNVYNFNKTNYLTIGGAFGRVFGLTPAWLNSDSVRSTLAVYDNLATDLPLATLEAQEPLFVKGLGAYVASANGLTNEQLVALSSPTTGCLVGPLCVPANLNPIVENKVVSSLKACDSSLSPNISQEEKQAVEATGGVLPPLEQGLVLTEQTLKVNYEHPTHQQGLWNGQTAPTNAITGLWYPGEPPLVEGEQTIRLRTYTQYVEEGKILDIGGSIEQVGVDQLVATAWDLPAFNAMVGKNYSECKGF